MSDEVDREFVGDGRYALDRLLGTGGTGSVTLAYDTMLSRWVAIKRIPRVDDRVMREAQIIASISHPNIVMIHDIFEQGSEIFLVMELVLGPTLEELAEPMDEATFRDLAAQCLRGLGAAHEKSVVHRDLKPGNIMLAPLETGGYRAKILDFGQSRTLEEPSLQTIEIGGSVVGSIYMMSPEQLSHEPLDWRTDFYSLGCVFYQALTRQRPFNGASVIEVWTAHLQHRFVPLKTLRPDLPEALTAWVERLFARDRDARPASAAQALAALKGTEPPPENDTQTPVVKALPVATATGNKRVRLLELPPLKISAPISVHAPIQSSDMPSLPIAVKPLSVSVQKPQPSTSPKSVQRMASAALPKPSEPETSPTKFRIHLSRKNLAIIAATALLILGGIGTFSLIRYIANASASSFGTHSVKEKILQAKFYDLKQTSDGKPANSMTDPEFCNIVAQFVKDKQWDPEFLSKYYSASAPLFAPRLYLPQDESALGPKAFGVEKDVEPFYWLVHYNGKFRALKSGTFRFIGCGDNVLIVRLNKKNVLDGSGGANFALDWSFNSNPRELLGAACALGWQLKGGQWFELKKGEHYDIEIITGDAGGGAFSAFLFYEQKGETYPKREDGSGYIYPLVELDNSAMPPINKPSPFNPPILPAKERIFEGVKP